MNSKKEKESVYYIGFNANNAICNEKFFAGSITLYPTKEKGNIFYSDILVKDTKSDAFMKKYKEFIYKNAKEIQLYNKNASFICFNEKIRKLCEDMKDINIVENIEPEIVNFLNNKFQTRDFVKDCVPILEYYYFDKESIKYNLISEKLKSKKFVIQGETGAGGNSTYLITNKEDLEQVEKESCRYCISKYVEHLPLNITLVIGKDDIIYFPLSVQLILLTNNKFKYVGGDFNYIKNLDTKIIESLYMYSKKIGEKIKNKGYRGILGIDYILTKDGEIKFMEINPRFQASSFLISINLEKKYHINIAELHYLALLNRKLEKIDIKMEESFVNCNIEQQFDSLINYKLIENGYFRDNKSSVYRKVFNTSILLKENFEKIN